MWKWDQQEPFGAVLFKDKAFRNIGVPSKRPMYGSGERDECFFHAMHVDSGCYRWCMLEGVSVICSFSLFFVLLFLVS